MGHHHKENKSKHSTVSSEELRLILTDAINRPDAQLSFPFISPNGELIFVVYQYPVPSVGLPAAELFQNINGRLVSIRTFLLTPEFPVVFAGGSASPDFSRFVVLTQSGVSGIGSGLVTILDVNFNVIAQRIIPNLFLDPGSLLSFRAFTPGNTFVAISFANNFAPDQTSNLLVLETTTLQTVVSTTFIGFSNGPSIFTLQDKCHRLHYYILIAAGQQLADGTFVTPANAFIWEFIPESASLTLVATTPLPQFSSTQDIVQIDDGHVLIGLPTNQATLFGEASPFIAPTASFIPNDGNELRIYKFNGLCLEPIILQNIKTTVYPFSFYPNGKYLVYGLRSLDLAALGIFSIDVAKKQLHGAGDRLYPIPPIALGSDFSTSGKWFVVGGGNLGALNSLQLYVVSQEASC